MLAFDAALESPERLVAVVGVAAGLGGFDSESTADEEVVEQEYERVDKADPFDANALTAFEVKVWVDGPLQRSGRVASAIRDLVYEMDLPLNEEGHVTGRERRLDPPAVRRVGELRCPILAIAGELDFSGVAAAARHVEANAPNATADIWPDVAHMIGMEQPERLAWAITAFVAPLRPWG
jgi:pimeloyl-ACP methyl ester carboxylesterase